MDVSVDVMCEGTRVFNVYDIIHLIKTLVFMSEVLDSLVEVQLLLEVALFVRGGGGEASFKVSECRP